MQPTTVSTTDATAGTTYSSLVRMDSWANAQSVVQVTVTGTATYTVETSMDDPNSPTNPVAVGDHVNFEYEEGKLTGVINKIFERKNYIIRKSVNLSKQTHIIASNIDTAFILVTIDSPPTSPGFIDRFLATAEAYSIHAVILFNKIDMYTPEQLEIKAEYEAIYTEIGYQCIDVSATNHINIDNSGLITFNIGTNSTQSFFEQ